ncbi:MAG TPA: cytochrome P450 [Candidatus Dormibacteraeota bacterium]|nr:cytochrome P450 [Candidatus Dormibacteraeota bacterium]
MPAIEFNPYSYKLHEDPYPTYRALRDHAPVYRNDALGFWALSRHADVTAAFKDPVTFSNAEGVALERSSQAQASATASFLAMDPPRHDQMRALVSRGFTPRRVADLAQRIRVLTDGYVDRFAPAGRCDLIQDLAGLLPMAVVSELLGIREEDRDRLRTLADTVVHREDGKAEIPPAAMRASQQMMLYFRDLVAERSQAPGGDLVSALLASELDGVRLAVPEVLAFLFLMVIAGNETTTKLIGNAVYWLWRHPGERAQVRRDPSLIPNWIEETLRYDGSTQMLARAVTRDLELHGQPLRAGDRLLLLVGAANRDERVFADPDRFDIRRDTGQHLAFGRGTHFCLGAALARLETRIALEAVQTRLPDFELDVAGLVRVHSPNVRGFASMPLRFRAAR